MTNISKLPIRPIVSNIGTATYMTAKYLSKLLATLAKSEYTIENSKQFVEKMKDIKPNPEYEMISFDVVSLFTNVPLERTIEIILEKVYTKKLINTKIPRNKMKSLLYLCTKDVHFTFDDETYQQVDGVMMGSPLGPLFANVFMCELENTLIPKLKNEINTWTRYVDDTFAFIDPNKIEHVKNTLNSFDIKIQFTLERENNRTINFLDVLVERTSDNAIQTRIYRKSTNTDVYINWFAHSPKSWKINTLKNLIKRAKSICSSKDAFIKELEYIKKVFCERNQYPQKMVENIILDEMEKFDIKDRISKDNKNEENNDDDNNKQIMLNLPYGGEKGENIMNKMRKVVENKTKKQVKIRIVYNSTKLGSRFPIKDKTKFEHLHNVTYHVKCPTKSCRSHYGGQTKCRIVKRILGHNNIDKASHVLRHSKEHKHKRVWLNNVKILGKSYRNNFIRKISESLFIRELNPDLNKQKDAYKLKLFN